MQRKSWLRLIYGGYAIGLAMLVLLPRETFPDFYNPIFMAGISVGALFLIMLIGWIYNPHGDARKQEVVEKTQLAMMIVVLTNSAGGLGLYKLYLWGIPYDKALHYVLPGVFVVSIAYFLHKWYGNPLKKSVFRALVIVIAFSFIWEAMELVMDFLFKTKTAGNYGTDYWKDTTQDIIADVIGAGVAGYLTVRTRRFK